jgi:hypothetical protein
MLSENVPSLVQGQDLELAAKWAAEWGISVEDVLASQDDRLPKAVVALSRNLSWERLWSAKKSWKITQQICVTCIHGT